MASLASEAGNFSFLQEKKKIKLDSGANSAKNMSTQYDIHTYMKKSWARVT